MINLSNLCFVFWFSFPKMYVLIWKKKKKHFYYFAVISTLNVSILWFIFLSAPYSRQLYSSLRMDSHLYAKEFRFYSVYISGQLRLRQACCRKQYCSSDVIDRSLESFF